jgi:xylulokinase
MIMAAYLGIDLGTTALKAVISDGRSRILAEASVPVPISHPKPGWSEQDPTDWWRALQTACRKLKPHLSKVNAIGFSGQMHGLVLLDKMQKPLRPAILWNDARAAAEATELNQRHPDLAAIAGVRAMASFFAPKLVWMQKNEPRCWARVKHILAPKDYLRFLLTSEYATDPVDASGMWLCDVAKRDWSTKILEACGTPRDLMPPILEAPAVAGTLSALAAKALGLPNGILVVTGTGDAAASCLGLGLVNPGDGVISIGTSAQIIVTKDSHVPAAAQNIHAFCHGVPERWFQMAALLNGASPLAWLGTALGKKNLASLTAPIAQQMKSKSGVMFLPYLNGERTPHDDPHAKGAFIGLDHRTGPTELARAVMEGVALSLADCYDILNQTGTVPERLLIIGGGTKSSLWMKMIASALGRDLLLAEAGEYGASLGAARLARMGPTGEPAEDVCQFPRHTKRISPHPLWQQRYKEQLQDFRRLYHAVKDFCPAP